MSDEKRDWAIVGGGILGGSLALRLAQRGDRVTIYERSSSLGGLASTFQIGDVTWDRFYHVTLQSDAALRSLLDELELDAGMRWVATGTGLFAEGQLYPVSSTTDYVKLPVLGPISKARIGATVLRAAGMSDWAGLEMMTAEEWLVRWSGRRAYETFWRPLLRSKLGDRHSEASAAFIWAIIDRLYAARRAGMKQDLFGYVPGGYAIVLDRLQSKIEQLGVVVRTSTDVRSVTADGDRVRIETTGGADVHDEAVVTTPSPVAARLVPQLSEEERRAHESIMYQGIVCVSLLLDRPVSPYYVTNITDESFPFTGVIEMTALVDPSEFGGRTLVYLPKYLAPDDELFEVADDRITISFVESLSRMYPSIGEANIVAAEVSRARHVLPVSTVGYSHRLPPMASSVPGVHIINTAHIVNGTLNINETLDLANRALPGLLGTPVAAVTP